MTAVARTSSLPRFALPFSPLFGGRLPRSPASTSSCGSTSSSSRASSSERTQSVGRTSTNSSQGSVSPPASPRCRRDSSWYFGPADPPLLALPSAEAEDRQASVLSGNGQRAQQNMLLYAMSAMSALSAGGDKRRQRDAPCRRDVTLADAFAPGTWLDDASITAAYAAQRRLIERGGGPHPILLMEPSVTFWLALSERGSEDAQEAVRGLELDARRVVLCPINDCQHGLRNDSGTHWSLLVCVARSSVGSGRREFAFMHYNSAGSSSRSRRQAQRVAEQLGGPAAKVHARPCAQQENCFDCGVYVLMFSDIISSLVPHGGCSTKEDAGKCRSLWEEAFLAITPRQATEYRARQRKALADPH